jgi:hypothetical protein
MIITIVEESTKLLASFKSRLRLQSSTEMIVEVPTLQLNLLIKLFVESIINPPQTVDLLFSDNHHVKLQN